MSDALAIDTSVSVPYLLTSHPAHAAVSGWARGRRLCLTGHSLAETYSVLTRLPDVGVRMADDVARAIEADFDPPLLLPDDVAQHLPRRLADAGIAGGATYDAMVGLAAAAAGVRLATRDARAASTYRALRVDLEIVAQP